MPEPERHYEYHVIEFPGLPGVLLPCAFERDAGKLWFPVVGISEALKLDPKGQREKVKTDSDYVELRDQISFKTDRGERPTLSLEWEGLSLYFIKLQESRIGKDRRETVQFFKRRVMKAAQDILLGRKSATLALPGPTIQQRQSAEHQLPPADIEDVYKLALNTEERVERVERAVFVFPADDDAETVEESDNSRIGRCPECGATFVIEVDKIIVRPMPRGSD